MSEKVKQCENCKKTSVWSKYCGAYVCTSCGHHNGFCQCFCGWNLSQGEVLEDDIGIPTYQGDGVWEVDY